ncbi:hypothetical protein BB560_002947 [Smittium megazygosporum]|uniref:PCI domain-containing protein n=1 Tax=Smittium megazygosporum TaxID=133381 RepID=A0A2T9ZDD4_9FUNG|nr:hypothetical protein BB560_002947 [Smittium megazygosporum]
MSSLINSIYSAYQSTNPKAFADCFPVGDHYILLLSSQLLTQQNLFLETSTILKDKKLIDFTAGYFRFVMNYPNQNSLNRWLECLSLCNQFIPLYSGADNFWLTETLKNISRKCFQLYLVTPPCLEKKAKSNEMGEFLQRAVKIQMSDRNPLPYSKRAGIYFMISMLMNFSIKEGTMGPVSGLVANITQSGPPLSEFPILDQVSFKYWMGRHYLMKHQIKLSKKELEFAFKKCPSSFAKNKRFRINQNISLDGSVIRLDFLLKAIQLSTKGDVDYDNVECIVSNLIEQGYIRGHIQLTSSVLVVSKSTPFPPVKSLKPPVGLPF